MNSKTLLILILLTQACTACATDATDQDRPSSEQELNSSIDQSPCNPQATAQTRKVYDILLRMYGRKTISGVVARIDWNTDEADNVYAWTGHYPALNCFDFINIHASRDVNPNGWLDYSDLSPVVGWWNQGGLVSCMWHWQVKANNGTDYTCSPGTQPGQTSFDPQCIENPGSADYRQLIHDLDQVCGYLQKMQKAGIPVIWRPLHEASGNTYEYSGGQAWFWWGAKGGEAYKKLWRFIYDYMVSKKGLNNLIWVWNSQMGDHAWYPGDDVVDIVGRDSYYALQYPLWKEYRQLSQEYPNKLIALAECGNGDEVDMSLFSNIWSQGSRWSWFMTWYDSSYQKGSPDHQFAGRQWWQDAMDSNVVIDRTQMKNLLHD